MATLWETTTSNSDLPVQAGNNWWDHLHNQSGAGGDVFIQIFEELEVALMSDLEVELETEIEIELESDLETALEPEIEVEVC
ncbi:MAG: hypothetical protein DRH08_01040 [Deltaproteobacteria bacterium]|nr:MAG: hypothetical protein DRH08_01040 [Deltaproteobacteria bacterium]